MQSYRRKPSRRRRSLPALPDGAARSRRANDGGLRRIPSRQAACPSGAKRTVACNGSRRAHAYRPKAAGRRQPAAARGRQPRHEGRASRPLGGCRESKSARRPRCRRTPPPASIAAISAPRAMQSQ
ncbi:hypothetical protein VU09_25280 [Burkholderia pseudomallei]|nr:hypothetical protein VU09_25280 [Burkholderia pseudomallei]